MTPRSVLLLFVIALLLAACGGGAGTPATPPADAASAPRSTPAAAEEIILPSPVPTETEVPAAPEATPLPPGQIGPVNFPPDVNPLTGLKVNDPAALQRRPLLIKVSNFPGEVRPQSGLSSADVVFEHYTEGGITRFTALFWTHSPEWVGSVRSARLIDLELPAMYKALFAYSGSSNEIKERIRNSDFFDRVFSPDWGDPCPLFCRVGALQPPNNEFASPTEIWNEATLRGVNDRPLLEGMVFNSEIPPQGRPGNIVRVVYTGGFARWDYDSTTGLYLRRQDGEPLYDRLNADQLSAANVVVVVVPHIVTSIIEDQASRRPGLEIQLWSSGDAYLYRDGMAYAARWARQAREDMLRFFYEDDTTPLPLKPGNTWVEFVGVSTKMTTEGAGDEWRFEPPPLGP